VEQLAAEENQPWVQLTGLLFEWRPYQPFDKDDDDPNYAYAPETDDNEYNEEDEWDSITDKEVNDNMSEDHDDKVTQPVPTDQPPNTIPTPKVVIHHPTQSDAEEDSANGESSDGLDTIEEDE
jgi:hypothetical protein